MDVFNTDDLIKKIFIGHWLLYKFIIEGVIIANTKQIFILYLCL